MTQKKEQEIKTFIKAGFVSHLIATSRLKKDEITYKEYRDIVTETIFNLLKKHNLLVQSSDENK